MHPALIIRKIVSSMELMELLVKKSCAASPEPAHIMPAIITSKIDVIFIIFSFLLCDKTRLRRVLFLVGLFGFEPKTSSMSTKHSDRLSYSPVYCSLYHGKGEITNISVFLPALRLLPCPFPNQREVSPLHSKFLLEW